MKISSCEYQIDNMYFFIVVPDYLMFVHVLITWRTICSWTASLTPANSASSIQLAPVSFAGNGCPIMKSTSSNSLND